MHLIKIIFTVLALLSLSACSKNQLKTCNFNIPSAQQGASKRVIHPELPYVRIVNVKGLESGFEPYAPVKNHAMEALSEIIHRLIHGTPEEMVGDYMHANNIFIDQMLLKEFNSKLALKQSSMKCGLSNKKSFAGFKLEIKRYGFHQVSIYSPIFKPVIQIKVFLVDEHNQVQWQTRERVTHRHDKTAKISMAQMLSEPESMKLALNNTVLLAVESVMNKIH